MKIRKALTGLQTFNFSREGHKAKIAIYHHDNFIKEVEFKPCKIGGLS